MSESSKYPCDPLSFFDSWVQFSTMPKQIKRQKFALMQERIIRAFIQNGRSEIGHLLYSGGMLSHFLMLSEVFYPSLVYACRLDNQTCYWQLPGKSSRRTSLWSIPVFSYHRSLHPAPRLLSHMLPFSLFILYRLLDLLL